jgi:hydrogenase nickel incorporation protein HypA/HybF
MHEFALAEAVMTAALKAAEKERMDTIERVVIRIGELQQIRKETFEFALREVLPAQEARLKGTRFLVEIEATRFRCRACEREFGLDEAPVPGEKDEAEAIHFLPELAHAFLQCPGCGSPDFEVAAGRGVSIEAIEGEGDRA